MTASAVFVRFLSLSKGRRILEVVERHADRLVPYAELVAANFRYAECHSREDYAVYYGASSSAGLRSLLRAQAGPAGPSGEHRREAGERGRPVPARRWREGGRMISSRMNGTSNGAASNAGRERVLVPAPDSSVDPAELNDLARELAASFGNMVNSYREHGKLSPEEAAKRAAQTSDEDIDRILNGSPHAVSWFDLDILARKDESLHLERWQQIKKAARDEFRSGYRAARAVEYGEGSWERACFLAVRAELMDDWRPRNTIEQLLVDQLAQWQVLLWRWQEALSTWQAGKVVLRDRLYSLA